MNDFKINWINAIVAGIIGTVAFDVIGYFLTGQWWDIAALIGEKTELGFGYGFFAHFSNGILLAIIYSGLAPSLWGPSWVRTLLFVSAETVALVWFFMLPLLGAGVAGLKIGAIIPVITLVRHLAYGVPLWYFTHKQNN